MDITIYPKKLSGTVQIIPSKSQAHRLLICAAFADQKTEIICPETNADIDATVDCLQAFGAEIHRTQTGFQIMPVQIFPEIAVLNCRESGSTLRFLLPVAGALGIETTFQMAGRLPERPLSPLKEEMERMGCRITRPTHNTLLCQGRLIPGAYSIDGSVSSQFISGLMFALTLLDANSCLKITGKIESRPYIQMTREALQRFGAQINENVFYPSMPLKSPGNITVEGDWSNGAFFLAANALSSDISVVGLNNASAQGDRICMELLASEDSIVLSAADVPDLIPILSVVAAAKNGGTFTDIARLRLKESDRVASTMDMLSALGVKAEVLADTLQVYPGHFTACTIQSHKDHRIAMASAIAATVADGPVTILDAECVSKSYPQFWEVYKALGGNYEQHLR